MADIKKLLEIRKFRKKRKGTFRRTQYGIFKKIGPEWRKPKGRHNKLRHQSAGHKKLVKPGFRTNKLVKGLHMSGLLPVTINSLNHISLLDKKIHGAIIGGNVGDRKRLLIIAELKKHGIKILNLKDEHEKTILQRMKDRTALKEEKKSKKAESGKKSKKEIKKEEKELTQEEKEVKAKEEKDRIITKAK